MFLTILLLCEAAILVFGIILYIANQENKKVHASLFAILCGLAWIAFIPFWVWIGGLWLFAAWVGILIWAVKRFLISVPEVTGLFTINPFMKERHPTTGEVEAKMHPYGPGLHVRYPWEEIKPSNFFSLDYVTVEIEESYPTSDGPLMEVKWSYQYVPRVSGLIRYARSNKGQLEKQFTAIGSAYLSTEIAKRSAIWVKKHQDQIASGLVKMFSEVADPNQADVDNLFSDLHEYLPRTDEKVIRVNENGSEHITPEDFYGVDVQVVTLSDVDYEKSFQQARTTKASLLVLKSAANSIQKQRKLTKAEEEAGVKLGPRLTDKESMNTALIVDKHASKSVVEVEGEAGQALAALIAFAGGAGQEKSKKGGK